MKQVTLIRDIFHTRCATTHFSMRQQLKQSDRHKVNSSQKIISRSSKDRRLKLTQNLSPSLECIYIYIYIYK